MAYPKYKERMTRVGIQLPSNVLKSVTRVPFDKYILMSGLQKSIRRGDSRLAASFALSLWEADKRALWRRLAVIAVEDVAMGDIDLTLDVLVCCISAIWRRPLGDAALGVWLAKQMADAPKTRFLSELYFYSERAEATDKARKWAVSASNNDLTYTLLSNDKPLYERTTALWGLLGSETYKTKIFKKPNVNIEKALNAIRELPVPDEVIEISLASHKKPHWPLAALLPLGWLAYQKEGENLRVKPETPTSSPECVGLPAYALDGMYTRPGLQSVTQLQKAVPSLQRYTKKQIGEGLFFIEAETLNPRLTSESWAKLRRDSINAIMKDLGLDHYEYMALIRCLIKHMDTYNDIRLNKIEALSGQIQNSLLTDKQ